MMHFPTNALPTNALPVGSRSLWGHGSCRAPESAPNTSKAPGPGPFPAGTPLRMLQTIARHSNVGRTRGEGLSLVATRGRKAHFSDLSCQPIV